MFECVVALLGRTYGLFARLLGELVHTLKQGWYGGGHVQEYLDRRRLGVGKWYYPPGFCPQKRSFSGDESEYDLDSKLVKKSQ